MTMSTGPGAHHPGRTRTTFVAGALLLLPLLPAMPATPRGGAALLVQSNISETQEWTPEIRFKRCANRLP